MKQSAEEFLSNLINSEAYFHYARLAHEAWMNKKEADGWTYAKERNDSKKENDLLVNFENLPQKHKNLNKLSPYAVINFFRKEYPPTKKISTDILKKIFNQIITEENQHPKAKQLLEQVSEYMHSHFLIGLISQGYTPDSRLDMVVYQHLSENNKQYTRVMAIEIIKYINSLI